MDFLTDTDTHMDSGWHDYQEVFELNWELAQ